MDNVIEALGKGKKKQGKGFEDVKAFVKKHHGKLAAVAGALGTIGTIALLSEMSGKKKPEGSKVLNPEDLKTTREYLRTFRPENPFLVPHGIPLRPEHKAFLREREEQKQPRVEEQKSRRSSLLVPLPQTPPLPVRRVIPQAVPIVKIKGPPPTGKKKGEGKKKKMNNSLIKKVMKYKMNNNVSLKEAWKAVRGF